MQQLLFSATLKIDGAARGGNGAEQLKRARADVVEAIAAARSLSIELFPPALRQGSLPAALEWLADWTHQKYGIEIRVGVDWRADPVDEDVRLLLFESVRELLFNAVKHAHVDRVISTCRSPMPTRSRSASPTPASASTRFATFAEGAQSRGGLGLFGMRERLTVMGGHMEVDSEPGRGTRFVLRVPGAFVTAATAVSGSSQGDKRGGERAAERRPVRVLLADDHAVVREGLRELLSEQPQLEVVGEAADGVEAVAQAHALLPDVVVMDVSMPRMDGIEATRRIRAELPDVRVFGLSTQERSDGHPIERAGAAGYFSKNDGAERLIAGLIALQDRLGARVVGPHGGAEFPAPGEEYPSRRVVIQRWETGAGEAPVRQPISAGGTSASGEHLGFAALGLDLDLARLDAFPERQRQLQHPVVVGRHELPGVEEVRHRQGLLVTQHRRALFAFGHLGADAQGVSCHLEIDVLGVDARQRQVDPPAVVGRGHLEVTAGRGGAGRQIAPELIERAIDILLNAEDVVERTETPETEHGEPPEVPDVVTDRPIGQETRPAVVFELLAKVAPSPSGAVDPRVRDGTARAGHGPAGY